MIISFIIDKTTVLIDLFLHLGLITEARPVIGIRVPVRFLAVVVAAAAVVHRSFCIFDLGACSTISAPDE
jgi:hypothetical protein